MKSLFRQSVLILALAASVSRSGAIVVAAGTVNDTAPVGNPYFANVGQVNGASAVYLGGGWVMTAAHVAGSLPSSVSFGGTSYSTQSGSYQRLTNTSGAHAGENTDLVLFKLASDPGLSSLSLKSTSATVGDPVMYVGNGRVQDTSLTHWTVTPAGGGSYTWTETAGTGDADGFKTTGTHEVTWGVNDVDQVGVHYDIGYGDVTTFSTLFDSGAYANEAQAVNGDSGGGVFFFVNGHWVLGGLTNAVDNYTDQPADTAVFGQSPYALDLSVYADEISSITGIALVPEPSAMVMGLAGGMGLVVWRRRA